MSIGNKKTFRYSFSLKRCIVLLTIISTLFFIVPQAIASGAKDKLRYAQNSYDSLLRSESRKSSKALWLNVIKKFESVVKSYPKSEEASKALFTKGVIYREMFNYSITLGELYKSEKAFKRFLRKYPEHPLCADAKKNIAEIKKQKLKNNLIRVSTIKPNPEAFPGRDKALMAAKTDNDPKNMKKRYTAKINKTPSKEKTSPPKVEESIKIETVKYESPSKEEKPKRRRFFGRRADPVPPANIKKRKAEEAKTPVAKKETPASEILMTPNKVPTKIEVAKAEPPETTTKDEVVLKEEVPNIDNGTGGGNVSNNEIVIPSPNKPSDNTYKKEYLTKRTVPPKTEIVSREPYKYQPDNSTVDLQPPPRVETPIAEVMTIRYFSDTDHTRIVVDINTGITYNGASLEENLDVGMGPRIYIDLFDTRLPPGLSSPISIEDGLVNRIRWSQNRDKIVRVVLDLEDTAGYKVFSLKNPNRVVIDVLRN